jgi:tRNA(adenine34) deaminase
MGSTTALDRTMMQRCIALSVRSGEEGEYPYGAVICQNGDVIAESMNRVAREHDVTRHAEMVAISQAQKILNTVSLEECVIYVNAEPCAICSMTIREARIGRVVYALRSPHTGGVSKWPVLTDEDVSTVIPEVFAPPPEIIAGFMAEEADAALLSWNPLVWGAIKARGLFTLGPMTVIRATRRPKTLRQWILGVLRRTVFDRMGRR